MSIRIMFSVLRRHSLMPALVFLQVALACAILCNVLFLLWQRMEPLIAPTGIDGDDLILVDDLLSWQHPWSTADVEAGTQMLQRLPGVKAASAAAGLPMVTSLIYGVNLRGPTGVRISANGYLGRGLLDTLGARLVAGRDFLPSEYTAFSVTGVSSGPDGPQPIIITQAMADRLFPGGHAVGQTLEDPDSKGGHGFIVVGVVGHLLRNVLGVATDGRADYTVLAANYAAGSPMLSFAVRADPAQRELALRGVRELIHRVFEPAMRTPDNQDAHASVTFYNERRDAAFKHTKAVLRLFAGIVVAVAAVTGVGIMGLSGFWMQRRTRQIGIRRALGARKSDILSYFMAENALIVGLAVLFGMVLAYAGNHLLMNYYELQQLPWTYLPIGAVVLLALGQLAVLGPALRAARVPPVVATRSM